MRKIGNYLDSKIFSGNIFKDFQSYTRASLDIGQEKMTQTRTHKYAYIYLYVI